MTVVRNPLLQSFVLILIVYSVFAYFVHPRYLIEFSDGIAIAMSGAVMFLYGGKLKIALARTPDLYDLIMVGIAGGWATNMVDRTWRLVARVTDSRWMIDHPIIGFVLTALAFFAALHLMALSPSEDDIAKRKSISSKAWAAIWVSLFVGAGIGTLAIVIDHGLFEGNR